VTDDLRKFLLRVSNAVDLACDSKRKPDKLTISRLKDWFDIIIRNCFHLISLFYRASYFSFQPGDASNSHVSSSGLVLFFVGATRSVNVNVATSATTTTIQCESGDMLAFEGECGSAISCEVSSLPIDLRNRPSGISAMTYVIRFEWSQEHACSRGVTFTPQAPCPKRFPAWTAFGALGIDVEARQSGLPNSGLGLFLLRDHPRGGIVTEYDGALRHVRKVSGKRKVDKALSSHWRSLPACDLVIEGISESRGLFNGRGGASLANHKAGREANSKFEIIWSERDRIPRFCEDDGCHYVVPRIVLTLLKPAFKGDEIFVDYGEDTAKHFLLSSPLEKQGALGRKFGSSPFNERLIFDASGGQRAKSPSGVVTQPLTTLTVQAVLVGEQDDIQNQSLGEMVSDFILANILLMINFRLLHQLLGIQLTYLSRSA